MLLHGAKVQSPAVTDIPCYFVLGQLINLQNVQQIFQFVQQKLIEQSAKGHSCTVGSIHIMCQQLLSRHIFIGQSHTNQISNAFVTYPLTRPGTDIDQIRVRCQDVAI